MFNQFVTKFKEKMLPIPVEYEPIDVINAWEKVDNILKTSYTDVHVECAQNMFNRMLSYYALTPEQRNSPIITGMQDKINRSRKNVIVTCK